MFRFRHRTTDHPTQLNFEQLGLALPEVGFQVVTFTALAAGGIANGPLAAAWDRVPRLVVAQATTGGTAFFSNQYVIGTYNLAITGCQVQVGSGGVAFAANWTMGISYIAYF